MGGPYIGVAREGRHARGQGQHARTEDILDQVERGRRHRRALGLASGRRHSSRRRGATTAYSRRREGGGQGRELFEAHGGGRRDRMPVQVSQLHALEHPRARCRMRDLSQRSHEMRRRLQTYRVRRIKGRALATRSTGLAPSVPARVEIRQVLLPGFTAK